MTRHQRIVVRALTWNLLHGRDHPPAHSAAHTDARRALRREFATSLAELPWDLALLQETPPRWLRPLCRAAGASGASALTSRNFGHIVRAGLARLFPDVMRSNEGGSNQVLFRPPWRLAAVLRVTIAEWPERRRMLLVRLRAPDGRELVVANLHASTDEGGASAGKGGGRAAEVLAAADRAVTWAAGTPLVFGGDLNIRPGRRPEPFAELERRHGLSGTTAPSALDHLLVRGLATSEPPRALPPREVPDRDGRLIRLSDHVPVVAAFEVE